MCRRRRRSPWRSGARRAWRVAILDPGARSSERACHDGAEARTYASTVRQHIYWLSPQKFREYYRIEDGGSLMGFNAMQPGKVKKTDLIIAGVALLVIVALVLWAVL